jgi:hypothetical protein
MMAESKFTPGPWGVQKSETYKNTWRITADGQRLASLDGDDGEPEETKANAELMADAPRLLEVLRTLHDFALPLRHIGLAETSEQAFADARAILEKHCG